MFWLLLAQDDAAHGAEDVAHAVQNAEVMAMNWLPAVTALVVFLLAFGFLALKVWPMITKGLDDREQKIRGAIAEADAAKEAAEAALAEYRENLMAARKEASEMIAKARADAKTLGEQLRRQNEEDLSGMKQRATLDIDSAKQAAITQLHAEASALAAAIAGNILQREISVEDQQRLVEETLSEMGRMQEA
jgi:F-type H+-transporting ATPase subunit b